MGVLDALHDGGGSRFPRDHKTTLNIDIYPSTLVFFENIGHKYDFEGGGVVPGRVWGWWGGPYPKKKHFNRILIHIYLSQCLDYLSNQMHSNPFHMTKHIHQI